MQETAIDYNQGRIKAQLKYISTPWCKAPRLMRLHAGRICKLSSISVRESMFPTLCLRRFIHTPSYLSVHWRLLKLRKRLWLWCIYFKSVVIYLGSELKQSVDLKTCGKYNSAYFHYQNLSQNYIFLNWQSPGWPVSMHHDVWGVCIMRAYKVRPM